MNMEFNHAYYVIVFVSNLMLLFTYFVDQRKICVCNLYCTIERRQKDNSLRGCNIGTFIQHYRNYPMR